MGDRTYAQIEILRPLVTQQIVDFFDEEGWQTDDDGPPNAEMLAALPDTIDTVVYYDSEANHGGADAVKALVELGVPFTGYHDSGGDYGAMVFAFDGAKFNEVYAIDQEPAITVPESGQINQEQLADIMEYWAIYKRARTATEVKQNA